MLNLEGKMKIEELLNKRFEYVVRVDKEQKLVKPILYSDLCNELSNLLGEELILLKNADHRVFNTSVDKVTLDVKTEEGYTCSVDIYIKVLPL